MTFRTATITLVLATFSTTVLAAKSDTNNFLLINNSGKTIGNASYTIDKTKDGYKIKTRFDYHLPPPSTLPDDDATADASHRGGGAAVLEVQDTGEYKLDANGNLLSGFTQNMANQMMTSFQPDKKRDSIGIGHMQAGVAGTTTDLPVPSPQFLLAPDFDPSAIQMLLTTTINHPHPDFTYLLIVPGVGGRAPDNVVPVTVQLQTDTPSGTLDGKPIALKHYLMNFHTGHADLYTDADGNLMAAVIGPLEASYVRAKFSMGKS